MPKRLLTLPRIALAALAILTAAVMMLGISFASALMIESRSETVITEKLAEARMDWVTVETDGMLVHLSGTAANEAGRFRALNLVGSLVDSSRIRDALTVRPTSAITAPRFSVEMLRNDDGIQLGGLIPGSGTEGEAEISDLVATVNALTAEGSAPANMLQSADWPAPSAWDASLAFGVEALSLLKRSKISVTTGRVEITAITDSPAEKRRLETQLNRRKPANVELIANISAPRPVLTPFTLRFLKDANGARFDACSADTDRARSAILRAAAAAGMEGPAICTIGLGSPTPRWSEAAVAAIKAVSALKEGSVTFSDADVTFAAGEGVTEAEFENALGDLRAGLPDVFSLDPVPPRPDTAVQGPAEFTARIAGNRRVTLRGRLVDERQQNAVEAYARAAFGSDQVYTATVLDPALPDGWPLRVLAGIESLSFLAEGSLLVRPDTVIVEGVTGSQEARGRVTQILSAGLGQGESFRVDIRYDEALDPLAALPTPEECAAGITTLMAGGKISFEPGSAEITAGTAPLIGKLAELLTDCPPLALEIGGHTDSQGSESGNKALSQARAEAVMMALVSRRVDTSQMTAIGYGEANPIADNGKEAGREQNRRIEFVLKDSGAPNAGADAGQDSQGAGPDAEKAAEAAPPGSEAGASAVKEDETGVTGPDFSKDTSPSVAPAEKTIRPRTRPEEN